MKTWEYTKGLHQIGEGVYAYLSPDGSWGLSNAGLVVDGGASLLIDTLFDLESTGDMLQAMREREPSAASIDSLVITHANGDHFYGNELVKGAEIITTKACAEEMAAAQPQMLADLTKAAPTMGDMGTYFLHCFGSFKFDGLNPLLPTRTFEGSLDLTVGLKNLQLIQVGPAHTAGDCIVYLPQDRIVFAGDILFIGGTPIMWAGPVANWIKACDLILGMEAETIVPGHGPITNKEGVKAVKGYWEYLLTEVRKRYEAGMSVDEAAEDIPMGHYSHLTEAERIVVNVATLYKEFRGDSTPVNVLELLNNMAKLWLKSKKSSDK